MLKTGGGQCGNNRRRGEHGRSADHWCGDSTIWPGGASGKPGPIPTTINSGINVESSQEKLVGYNQYGKDLFGPWMLVKMVNWSKNRMILGKSRNHEVNVEKIIGSKNNSEFHGSHYSALNENNEDFQEPRGYFSYGGALA